MIKILILPIVIVMASCNAKTNLQDQTALASNTDTVIVSPNSILYSKIKTKVIKTEPYSIKVSTFGIVQAIPNNYAEIAPPLAGRITRSFVRLGQHVAVDEPIFEINSPAFLETSKLYFQAKQELRLADKNLRRQQDLYKNGVGVQKDLEEAEVVYELHKRDLENSIASLKVYKVDPENLVLGQALIVESPIAGEIVENKIVIGQYLKEDASPVAVVAELNKVWIVAQVKEKDISSIHVTESIEISIAALSDSIIQGTIYHISDMMDEETRSVQVFIECDNPDHSLKPGMYASVSFIELAKEKILIPASSVFQEEEESFVFISSGENRYIKRKVDIAGATDGLLLIKSGLETGERIISEGGYFLLDFN